MAKIDKISEFRFRATVDSNRNDSEIITDISIMDSGEELRKEKKSLDAFARKITMKFAKMNGNGGLLLASTSKTINGGWVADLEGFESVVKNETSGICHLYFKVVYETGDSVKRIKLKCNELERKNRLLIREIEKLDELITQLEEVKESFRIPFDAIKDLMMSFDSKGNILVVNEASIQWFGQSPQAIAKKKCRTLLNQDIATVVSTVCKSKESKVVEQTINDRLLLITYIPMVNKKNGETEVVMLAQDITKSKMAEAEKIMAGRNEAVSVMGGTVRHILNSSLTAILGFAQLALSSYEWPKETMIRYLKLIERTALRMKLEISKIAEQKEFVTTKYVDVPGTEDCKEIIKIEIDRKN